MDNLPVAGQRVRAELDAESLLKDWVSGSEFEDFALPSHVSHLGVDDRLALVCEAFLGFGGEGIISVSQAATVAGEARITVEISGAFKRHVALFAQQRNCSFGHFVSSSIN